MLKKKIRRIRRRHKRHGSGCGYSGSSTSWDADGMIGLGLLVSPFLLIGGIGWGLWKGYLYVLEKVFKKCRHDPYAVYKREHNLRFCGECDAWQTVDASQMVEIKGEWRPSEKVEWQPSETRPQVCSHFARDEIVETGDGTIGICPRCGCWRTSRWTELFGKPYEVNGPWEPARTCPINEERDGGDREPAVASVMTD